MQPKVSMVMPCYNKAEYIGEMFESVIAQKWDNIELILVNDGSTDGTREIIADYIPKFIARGFEAVVIDQENAGVCAAAKAGLMRVTGDYVCMVDSDDELDPAYVSTMAGWLEGHHEHDFCVCEAVEYKGRGSGKEFVPTGARGPEENDPRHLERYLLLDIRSEAWVYMARAAYIKKCNIPHSYYTDTRGSHEPGFNIPLLAHKGGCKYFCLPLYRFNISGVGHSRPGSLEKQLRFYEEYQHLCEIAVDRLPDEVADAERKAALKKLAYVARHRNSFWHTYNVSDNKREAERALIERINAWFVPSPNIGDVAPEEMHYLIKAVEDNILGRKTGMIPQKPAGRVIAWGVLGKRGQRLLPLLKGSLLEPTELWDAAGDGKKINKPAPTSLCVDDLVLVLPIRGRGEIYAELNDTGCKIMNSDDILRYNAYLLYRQFYSGSLIFKPERA